MTKRERDLGAKHRHRFRQTHAVKVVIPPEAVERILALESREGLTFDRLIRYWALEGLERAEQYWLYS